MDCKPMHDFCSVGRQATPFKCCEYAQPVFTSDHGLCYVLQVPDDRLLMRNNTSYEPMRQEAPGCYRLLQCRNSNVLQALNMASIYSFQRTPVNTRITL